jgi:hypothetical protein
MGAFVNDQSITGWWSSSKCMQLSTSNGTIAQQKNKKEISFLAQRIHSASIVEGSCKEENKSHNTSHENTF